MQKFNKIAALASVLIFGTATAHAETYQIDPNHANVYFSIDHFGTSTNHGAFTGVKGTVDFDPANRTGSVDIDIPVTSLETGNEQFTNHLKSAEIFNVEQYPNAHFKSTKFYFNGKNKDGVNRVSRVDGQLTLLGQTHPVTLTATKFNCYQSPRLKTQVCGGDFVTSIDRTRWGLDYGTKMGLSKYVKLNIQIEAAKPQVK